MRLIVVVGARPNVIKVGPLLPELARAGVQVDLAFTGTRASSRPGDAGGAVSFYGVELPEPTWFVDIGAGTSADTTGRAMLAFEALFSAQTADAVMAIGDSDTALAVAISAAKAALPVIHLDAGLRCSDLRIPEEINRVLISRVAAAHLTPTERALENLEDEGIEPERIHFVGSPMAESVLRHSDRIARLRACGEYGLTEGGYVLASLTRAENLGDEARFRSVLGGLGRSPLPVLVPDTMGFEDALGRWNAPLPASVRVVKPVSYHEMLSLERDSACIITDSGGVQVEACMLMVPCVTVRDCTEWTSTVSVGANRLCRADAEAVRIALTESVGRSRHWNAPKRWDRAVSDRVARLVRRGVAPLV